MSDDVEMLRLNAKTERGAAWRSVVEWDECANKQGGFAENCLRVANGKNRLSDTLDRAADALEFVALADGAEPMPIIDQGGDSFLVHADGDPETPPIAHGLDRLRARLIATAKGLVNP